MARKRRRRQNTEIDELGELLPAELTEGKALDKISTLRLTISYLRFQSFLGLGGCESIAL